MGSRLVSKVDARNAILAARLAVGAVGEVAQRGQPSPALRDWLDGYHVALVVVAIALGVSDVNVRELTRAPK